MKRKIIKRENNETILEVIDRAQVSFSDTQIFVVSVINFEEESFEVTIIQKFGLDKYRYYEEAENAS